MMILVADGFRPTRRNRHWRGSEIAERSIVSLVYTLTNKPPFLPQALHVYKITLWGGVPGGEEIIRTRSGSCLEVTSLPRDRLGVDGPPQPGGVCFNRKWMRKVWWSVPKWRRFVGCGRSCRSRARRSTKCGDLCTKASLSTRR